MLAITPFRRSRPKPQPENRLLHLSSILESLEPLLASTAPVELPKAALASNACFLTTQIAASRTLPVKPSLLSKTSAAVPIRPSHQHFQKLQAAPPASQIEMHPARPAPGGLEG